MTQKRTWTFALLTVALIVTLAFAGPTFAKKGGNGGGGGGGGGEDPPPQPDLPPVRYRVNVVDLPANSTGDYRYVNDISNWGVVVGLYTSSVGNTALIYFPGDTQAIDLNTLVESADMPENARLRSGVSINDWGVVVGALEYDTGEVAGFALDLGSEHPVIDLLPYFGSDFSYGWQINENGDILGAFQDTDGRTAYYLFNPGFYGDPLDRVSRDGTPQDLTAYVTEPLPAEVAYGPYPVLNNPLPSRPPQIATNLGGQGSIVRYTTGATPNLEVFSELDASGVEVYMNDSGTFCGVQYGPKIKGKVARDVFRYDDSVEILPISGDLVSQPLDINSSGDLITASAYIYRDEWGYVNIDDIVTGTDLDLATWFSGGSVKLTKMNDRAGITDSPQILAQLNQLDHVFVVLTPEPAPE